MCDACVPAGGWTRRRLLGVGVGGAAASLVRLPAAPAQAAVQPRGAWAGTSRPPGPLEAEADVRFLVVHHTVTGNDYEPEQVVPLLQAIHRFHTGAEKGWPDIAYNFVVDRFGRIWEGRQGSLAGPVVGDATGGNQGFDQKCAFLGDHRTERPSDAALAAMESLLAFLADRDGVPTSPGVQATFVSRGSNLHPAGTEVTTPTITGHRTMSATTCPGDAAFALVRDRFPTSVTAARSSTSPPSTSTTAAAPSTTGPTIPPPPSDAVGSSTAPTSTTSLGGASPAAQHRPAAGGTDETWGTAAAVGGAAAVGLGALLALRRRRS